MRRRIRGAVLVTIAGLAASCVTTSSSDGESPGRRAWRCFESSSGCGCEVEGPGETMGGSGEISRCASYSCCFLTEPPVDANAASCNCLDVTSSCEAEAASRRDARVVSACPPTEEQAPVACAAAGENCRREYLNEQELEGCCAGTLCKSVNGVPVCSAATSEELALDAECRKVQDINPSPAIVEPLQTTTGPLSLDDPYVRNVAYGPGGCLVSVELSFSGGCILSMIAGPERDAEGRLVVHEDIACASLSGPVEGTLAFDGVSCLKSIGSCFTGTLEFRLTTPPTTDPFRSALTGAPFVLRGSFCDIDGFVERCP